MRLNHCLSFLSVAAITVTAEPIPAANYGTSITGTPTTAVQSRDYTVDAVNFLKTRVIEPVYHLLGKRANNVPAGFVVGNEAYDRFRYYTNEDINTAVDEGVRRVRAGELTPPWGQRGRQYPTRHYDGSRRIRGGVNVGPADINEMYEFPIVPNRGAGYQFPYAHGDPGMDRVIFDRNYNFITIVAHETGMNHNDFVPGYAAQVDPDFGQVELLPDNTIGNWNEWRNNRAARGGINFMAGYAFTDKMLQFWPR